jgi:hypothetical protein
VARRDPAPQVGAPQYDAAGDPVVITPQPRQIAPQVRADGYIYPADGSSSDPRYPAPRGYRRMYDAQGQQYYPPQGYGAPQGYPAPQGYYVQGYPRPYYQQY